MANAREVAARTLIACERQGAWSDGYLKRVIHEDGLDRRDAALATRLCFGVLQNRMLLDWYLGRLSRIPVEKLDGYVRANLRIALYQLLFMEKIPASAAVNEAVKLTRARVKNPRAAGMVNGILRSFLRQREDFSIPTGTDDVETLSVRYSPPRWLGETFLRRLGAEQTEALLTADNGVPPMTVQINTGRGTIGEVKVVLEEDGVKAEAHPTLPDCLNLSETGNLEKLNAYQQGLFYVQDAAARLAVCAAGIVPGQRVLDCCASPGGKSFAAAIDMDDRGEVISCDIYPHKIALMEAGRDRLGLSAMKPILQDARTYRAEWDSGFDAVICDVPCSGLGIIRKKPDIRYKKPGELKGLSGLQKEILENCSRYVKRGGTLIYSTCTLVERENEDVVRTFLSIHPEFVLEPFSLPGMEEQRGMVTLWPHIHGTDGFFIAKLKRLE